MSQFVIRFDDITSSMNSDNFNKIKEVLLTLNIKPIIGVIPYCLDETLNINPPIKKFWGVIRSLKSNEWTIAQHGYTHQYLTNESGLLKINSRSEFSGIDYKQQFESLKSGKEILQSEKVWQPVFMAPAHSFDNNTLRALHHLNFKSITDGYGLYPYKMGELMALPNLFSSPKHIGFGIYTICLHTNNMDKDQLNSTISFIQNNRKRIISFEQALSITPPFALIDKPVRYLSSIGLRGARVIRKKLG